MWVCGCVCVCCTRVLCCCAGCVLCMFFVMRAARRGCYVLCVLMQHVCFLVDCVAVVLAAVINNIALCLCCLNITQTLPHIAPLPLSPSSHSASPSSSSLKSPSHRPLASGPQHHLAHATMNTRTRAKCEHCEIAMHNATITTQ